MPQVFAPSAVDAINTYQEYMKPSKVGYRIENAKELTAEQWEMFDKAIDMFGNGRYANKKIAEYMNGDIHVKHVRKYKAMRKKQKENAKKIIYLL